MKVQRSFISAFTSEKRVRRVRITIIWWITRCNCDVQVVFRPSRRRRSFCSLSTTPWTILTNLCTAICSKMAVRIRTVARLRQLFTSRMNGLTIAKCKIFMRTATKWRHTQSRKSIYVIVHVTRKRARVSFNIGQRYISRTISRYFNQRLRHYRPSILTCVCAAFNAWFLLSSLALLDRLLGGRLERSWVEGEFFCEGSSNFRATRQVSLLNTRGDLAFVFKR